MSEILRKQYMRKLRRRRLAASKQMGFILSPFQNDLNAWLLYDKVEKESEQSLVTDPLKPSFELLGNALKEKGSIDKADLYASVFVFGLELINKGLSGIALDMAKQGKQQIAARYNR